MNGGPGAGVLDHNTLREVVSGPSRYRVNVLSEKPDPEGVGRCWRRTNHYHRF